MNHRPLILLLLASVLLGCPPERRGHTGASDAEDVAVGAWQPEAYDAALAAPWSDIWSVERMWAEQALDIQMAEGGRRKLRAALAWSRPSRLRMKVVTGIGFGVLDLAIGPGGWKLDSPMAGTHLQGGLDERPETEGAPFPADLLLALFIGPGEGWGGQQRDDGGYALGPMDSVHPHWVLYPVTDAGPARALGFTEGAEALSVHADDFQPVEEGSFPWFLSLTDSAQGTVVEVRTDRVRSGIDVPASLFPSDLEVGGTLN